MNAENNDGIELSLLKRLNIFEELVKENPLVSFAGILNIEYIFHITGLVLLFNNVMQDNQFNKIYIYKPYKFSRRESKNAPTLKFT